MSWLSIFEDDDDTKCVGITVKEEDDEEEAERD
jgi:hypothetical protein